MAYQYDTASRLLALDNFTASGQYAYDYTYDDVGNRAIMSVTDGSGTRMHVYYDTRGNMTADGHYAFTYDPENRLTRIEQPNAQEPLDDFDDYTLKWRYYRDRHRIRVAPSPSVVQDGLGPMLLLSGRAGMICMGPSPSHLWSRPAMPKPFYAC
jgi:YD repeat-containing protein